MSASKKETVFARAGFTLIELLVFGAIFIMIIGSFVTILVAVTTTQSSQTAAAEVTQQSQVLLQQIQYYVKSARIVDMMQDVTTSTLVLREPFSSSTIDPTRIWASGGVVYLQQGVSSTPQALTSNKVNVTQINFTRHYTLNPVGTSTAINGVDSVSFSFTIAPGNTNSGALSQTIQGSAFVSTAVPRVAIVQQTKVELLNSGGGAISGVSTTFPMPVEVGDSLVAVLTITQNSVQGETVSDSLGNVWNAVASNQITTGSKTALLNVFEARITTNATDTVSIPDVTGSYISLIVYEYRGLPPVQAFTYQSNIQATQFTGGTSAGQNPVSSAMFPTVGPILLMSIAQDATTPEIPIPQTGYTLETTSTVSQTYIADQATNMNSVLTTSWHYNSSPATTSLTFIGFLENPPSNGWIQVPGNSQYGTTAGFWVMKYDANCYDPSQGNGVDDYNGDGQYVNTGYNTYDDRDYSCLYVDDGYVDTGVYGYPLAMISHDMAQQYCKSINAHLLTNDEWMTIADNTKGVGSNWTGGAVGSGSMMIGNTNGTTALAPSANDANGWAGETATTTNSRRTLTLSNGQVIWDFAGNLWQEVQRSVGNVGDNTSTITNVPLCSSGSGNQWCEYAPTSTSPYITTYRDSTLLFATVGPGIGSWNSTQGIGAQYVNAKDNWVNASGTTINNFSNTIVRGGTFNDGIYSGPYALTYRMETNNADVDTGFRCAVQ